MSNKRQRTETHTVVRGSKMAKDKSIIESGNTITSAAGAGSLHVGLYPQSSDASAVANRPLTVSGLRWNISAALGTTATGIGKVKWAIWVRRKGQSIPNVGVVVANTQDAFGAIDEGDILVWGNTNVLPQSVAMNDSGATKTQRKMQQGDVLVLSIWTATAGATDTTQMHTLVQTFLKS